MSEEHPARLREPAIGAPATSVRPLTEEEARQAAGGILMALLLPAIQK